MLSNDNAVESSRITSIDVVRGLVMVLMAIDHVRVYSGQPAGGPTPGIFFTRWITHFVAPAFVFFAGTGAFLHGQKLGDRGKLARFLVSRGLWLVLLELTFLRFAWTFNFDYAHYSLAGVIWMIGWCMVLLAGIIYLPTWAVAAFGVITIVAHPVLYSLMGAPHAADGSFLSDLFKVLYLGEGFSLIGTDGPPLLVLFVIIPWIGVMAAGYAFGPVMRWPAERRRAFCLRLGIGATVLFVALRSLDGFGDPRHWHDQMTKGWPGLLAFLNTSKYPASFLFLLMTLGPTITLLPLVEGAMNRMLATLRSVRANESSDNGQVGRALIGFLPLHILEMFGRVPLFYYVLHIPLIHLAAIAVSLIRTGAVNPWLFANHPLNPGPVPPGYMWSLPLLYLVWAIVIVILFYPCAWYYRLKSRNKSPWLSYL